MSGRTTKGILCSTKLEHTFYFVGTAIHWGIYQQLFFKCQGQLNQFECHSIHNDSSYITIFITDNEI